MLFAVKWSNYFYARKGKRTLYGGSSSALSKGGESHYGTAKSDSHHLFTDKMVFAMK